MWTPERIKDFRLRLGLTQKAFGKLLGVTDRYIFFLEKGVKKPSKTLQLLLDCLEKTLPEGKKKKKGGGMEFKVQRIGSNPSGIAIVSFSRETRGQFPPPGQPFTLVVDDLEYETSIRNLSIGWTSIAKTFHEGKRVTRAEFCERHGLHEGDRVFIEVLEPFKRYRLRKED